MTTGFFVTLISGAALLQDNEEAQDSQPTEAAINDALSVVDQIVSNITDISQENVIWYTGYSIAAIVGALVVRWLLVAGLVHLVKRLQSTKTAEGEKAASKLETLVSRFMTLIIMITTALVLLKIWNLDFLIPFSWNAETQENIISIGLILVLAQFANSLIQAVIDILLLPSAKLSARKSETRRETMIPVVSRIAKGLVWIAAILLTLAQLGLNTAPLLAGAGIIGIAIGFGSQSIVKDFLTGVLLVSEDALKVGDVVKIGSHFGEVSDIGMRAIKLRDLAGVYYFIPFSEVSTLENWTKDYSYAMVAANIAYHDDIAKAREIMVETAKQLREEALKTEITSEIEILGVDKLGDNSITILGRIRTLPEERWHVERAFRERMKTNFDEAGLTIPFPQRTLSFLAGDDGSDMLDKIAAGKEADDS